MFAKDYATLQLIKKSNEQDRRGKFRFPLSREMRFKVLKDGAVTESGTSETIDIGSGGVSFALAGRYLQAGSFIEVSISWPVLLEDSCPMRLIAFGRVVRSAEGRCACTIDKYEFRTQSRAVQSAVPGGRNDSMLQRWADTVRKEDMKMRLATA